MKSWPATLKCADPEKLREEDLPVIPAWWPLPGSRDLTTDDPTMPVLDRETVRRGRRITEAVAGPWDGQTVRVTSVAEAPPERMLLGEGAAVYTLDPTSGRDHLIYRYSPQLSSVHQGSMRAVEDAFREMGPDYAEEARQDDTSAHGYQDR